jgi:hypothetical protein
MKKKNSVVTKWVGDYYACTRAELQAARTKSRKIYILYVFLLPVDFYATYLALQLVMDENNPVPLVLITAGVTASLGIFAPHYAGAWLKDGVIRGRKSFVVFALLLMVMSVAILAFVTLLRLSVDFAAPTAAAAGGGLVDLASDTGLVSANLFISALLTLAMAITYMISFGKAHDETCHFDEVYFAAVDARLAEADRNAELHECLASLTAPAGDPEKMEAELAEQYEILRQKLRDLAVSYQQHARLRLAQHLGSPDATTLIMSAPLPRPQRPEDGRVLKAVR